MVFDEIITIIGKKKLPSTSVRDASFLGTTTYKTRSSNLLPTTQKLLVERVFTSVIRGCLKDR